MIIPKNKEHIKNIKPLYWILSLFYHYYQNQKFRKLEEFNNFASEQQLLIFSNARGGSTWLTEILTQIPNTAVIWEPLNLTENNSVKKIGFGWQQYIPENFNWPEAKEALQKILSGKELNRTTTFFERNDVNKYKIAKKLIIKFVNGNALLPWITTQFNLKYKPIYLIRHPFAVAASSVKHGAWDNIQPGFRIPEMKFNQRYLEHADFLKTLNSLEEKIVAEWCLSNLPTLRNENNNKNWITVNYDWSFLKNPLKRDKTFRTLGN